MPYFRPYIERQKVHHAFVYFSLSNTFPFTYIPPSSPASKTSIEGIGYITTSTTTVTVETLAQFFGLGHFLL